MSKIDFYFAYCDDQLSFSVSWCRCTVLLAFAAACVPLLSSFSCGNSLHKKILLRYGLYKINQMLCFSWMILNCVIGMFWNTVTIISTFASPRSSFHEPCSLPLLAGFDPTNLMLRWSLVFFLLLYIGLHVPEFYLSLTTYSPLVSLWLFLFNILILRFTCTSIAVIIHFLLLNGIPLQSCNIFIYIQPLMDV